MVEYAALIGAGVGLLSAGYGVVQGERANAQQGNAARNTQNAQQQALAQAQRAQKLQQEQVAQANRMAPNPGQILLSEYEMGRRTAGSTLLTQPQVDEQQRRSGPSLLGQ